MVDPNPIFVRDGTISTSAGVTTGIDLAIALVEEDYGRAVAEIARLLVVFVRRPGNQAQFSAQLSAQTARSDPLREVEYWAAAEPGLPTFLFPALAQRAGLSPASVRRARSSRRWGSPRAGSWTWSVWRPRSAR
ncbi:Transcriptional regulator OS=Streptomyces antimycoticus OX=68175 GN=SSPO_002110 PE=4 SV=1 [Streptomyces antimycoticus]